MLPTHSQDDLTMTKLPLNLDPRKSAGLSKTLETKAILRHAKMSQDTPKITPKMDPSRDAPALRIPIAWNHTVQNKGKNEAFEHYEASCRALKTVTVSGPLEG